MMAAGVIDPAVGLTDASGAGLARWLNVEYEAYGYEASNANPVSFDEVAAEAAEQQYPLMIGGRAWGHWSGCSGFDGARLILKNPAPGYKGVWDTMTRDQFAALGSFSMVRLRHPAAEGDVPPPQPPPELDYSFWQQEGRVGSGLIAMMREDGVYPAQDWSTWLPLGRNPAQIEECIAESGVVYRWLLTVSRGYRYRPT